MPLSRSSAQSGEKAVDVGFGQGSRARVKPFLTQRTDKDMRSQPVIHIVGARPQFIKLSVVTEAFRQRGVPFKVVHTGQHYDHSMSETHFQALKLDAPDYHLRIGSSSHARQTARMLEAVEEVLLAEKPSLVIVYGDTNSTLAGALGAVKLGIEVAHVEAGVRSFEKFMPEEINRVVTDHVASYHFCPTTNAVNLLEREGLKGMFTGDVMYDALLRFSQAGISHPYRPPFVLATIHRAENTDDPKRFAGIWKGLELVSRSAPVIFPAHPRTSHLHPELVGSDVGGLTVIEPVSYLTMLAMIRDAACIITDSGGVQKEAYLLDTPCVTVRDVTEWPETVEAGANVLVSPDPASIFHAFEEMSGKTGFGPGNPFGDGTAAERIARFVEENILPKAQDRA